MNYYCKSYVRPPRCDHVIVIQIMSDEFVWENKWLYVWWWAGMCLCVGCRICDNGIYFRCKIMCNYDVMSHLHLYPHCTTIPYLTCQNNLTQSVTTGKTDLLWSEIGSIMLTFLNCAQMILASFKATSDYAGLPRWFQTRRRWTASPNYSKHIATDTQMWRDQCCAVLIFTVRLCGEGLVACCGN